MKDYRYFTTFCFSFFLLTIASAQSVANELNSTSPAELIVTQAVPKNTTANNQNPTLARREKLLMAANVFIKNGFPDKAYALLHPFQSEFAGDPEFDYLLGIAALDSGKPNEAIFALERTLAVNPSHLQARAEIARAYLAAGELAEAKQEFETVQQQNPPQEVIANIQKYLNIIESARSGQRTSIRGYVEVTLGNDSNVNTATSNNQIAIPLFGGALMNLSASGIATKDTFGTLATGFNMRHALSPSWAVLGGANISKHNYSTQVDFNTTNGDANIGLSLNNGNDNYIAVLQAQSFVLANVAYRDAKGLSTQWQRNLNSGAQLSSYLQYSSLSYPDYKYRNADRYVLGGAYGTPLGADSATVIYFGLYGGAEQPLATGYTYLANNFYGGRMGGEMKLNSQFSLIASASMESRSYEGADTLFLVKRNDTQADLKLGMNYMPAQQWTISPSISYTSNSSNIIINQYDRTVFSVSARRDFN